MTVLKGKLRFPYSISIWKAGAFLLTTTKRKTLGRTTAPTTLRPTEKTFPTNQYQTLLSYKTYPYGQGTKALNI